MRDCWQDGLNPADYHLAAFEKFAPEGDSDDEAVSVVVLVMVVLGGMGNIRGVIVGAILVYFIQTYLLIQLPNWISSATAALNIDFLTKLDIASSTPVARTLSKH